MRDLLRAHFLLPVFLSVWTILNVGGWFLPKTSHAASTDPETSTASAPKATTADTAALYRRNCKRCHGEDGKGNAIRSQMPEIPDFTRRRWQESRTDAELVASTLDGKGVGMPEFARKISQDQARDLVAFVRALGPSVSGSRGESADALAAPVAPQKPDDFEERFRQLQQKLAELQRQFRELSPPSSKP
jgi:mono/diheme cytochrome c family protein